MIRRSALSFVVVALAPSLAWAEGSLELGTTQRLQAATEVWAEVASAAESICWTGSGTAQVFHPNNTLLATLSSGQCANPVGAGFHRIAIAQTQLAAWDCSVQIGGSPIDGRIFSFAWYFDATSFAEANAIDSSFYALLAGGAPGTDTVVELKLDGLAGFIYTVAANETGVAGVNAGRSVPAAGNNFSPALALYINPPDLAAYTPGAARGKHKPLVGPAVTV